MDTRQRPAADRLPERKPRWTRPTLNYVGSVGEVFLSGGGKISSSANDTGDPPFKPSGQG